MNILGFFITGAGIGVLSNAIKGDSGWLLILSGVVILAGIEIIIDSKIKALKNDLENQKQ